mmetsp:Transcript_7282/g.13673  ORF Transcript_7282/g.13673 Transcript_7282/m.13673 type:complete len:240 (-) Transcript_7282:108-827(-)
MFVAGAADAEGGGAGAAGTDLDTPPTPPDCAGMLVDARLLVFVVSASWRARLDCSCARRASSCSRVRFSLASRCAARSAWRIACSAASLAPSVHSSWLIWSRHASAALPPCLIMRTNASLSARLTLACVADSACGAPAACASLSSTGSTRSMNSARCRPMVAVELMSTITTGPASSMPWGSSSCAVSACSRSLASAIREGASRSRCVDGSCGTTTSVGLGPLLWVAVYINTTASTNRTA